MNLEMLVPNLRIWFENYLCRFDVTNPDVRKNTELKAAHTRRVCENIRDIGKSIALSRQDLVVAEAAALLHDIGRFEQYQRYRTFVDHKSENHAALGVRIIRENMLLEAFDPTSADIILQAVACHNRMTLPLDAEPHFLLILKLLRDADKVDIWRVVTEYYQNSANNRNQAVELDLPDNDSIADPVYQALMRGNLVRMADLRTLNDFKLLQIGWIYDVNFRKTFEIIRENRYLEIIRDKLPQKYPRIDAIYTLALAYIEAELKKTAGNSKDPLNSVHRAGDSGLHKQKKKDDTML
jgi:putative nucleotidyltransferase with HDIG domain